MRVAVALDEAKAVQRLLDDLEGSWLDELKDVVELLQRIDGRIADNILARAVNSDIMSRLQRIQEHGNNNTSGLENTHRLSEPLSTGITGLRDAALALLMSSYQLSKNVAINPRVTTLDGADKVIGDMRLFDIAKVEADAYVRAWLAFDGDDDNTIHQLTLGFVGQESPSISTVSALLELLDIWFIVAAAGMGDSDVVNKITIERIESGSVVAWFKNVPDEVWDKVVELWRRMINPELTRIDNVVAAANMLRIVGETAA